MQSLRRAAVKKPLHSPHLKPHRQASKGDWEISVPELGTSVFLIPADFGGRHERSGVKNGDERLVVLNSVAKSIIDKQRGLSKEWVFPYNGNAMHRMNDSAWKKAQV